MEKDIDHISPQNVCPQCGELLTLDLLSGQFLCKSCSYIKPAFTYSAPSGAVATAAMDIGEGQPLTIKGFEVTLPIVPKHTHEEISKIKKELAEIKGSMSAESDEIQLQEKICTWLNKTIKLEKKFSGQVVAITYDGEVLASAAEELELLESLHNPEFADKRFFIYSVPPAPIGRV